MYENIKFCIADYDEFKDDVIVLREYKRMPDFVTEMLQKATFYDVALPDLVVICRKKCRKRLGAYGKELNAIVLFTYDSDINTKRFVIAHELGHCDLEHKEYSKFLTKLQKEKYANKIAEILTDLTLHDKDELYKLYK